MNTIYWRMNATQGGANLHPGVNLLPGANLHPGANCAHEHGLRIQPARQPQGKKAPKRLDVSKLNHDSMRQAFINDISNQLGAMNLSSKEPEENWKFFKRLFILQLQLP